MPLPRQSDRPSPGYYLLRLVRGGPWVAAEIRHAAGEWECQIDGIWQGPATDPWSLPAIETIHWHGRECTEAEAAYRMGLRRWAETHAKDHPAANPRKAVDLDAFIPF